MGNIEPIAQGFVSSLAINGEEISQIIFNLAGPFGDIHTSFNRKLSGHDGEYIRTSDLLKGATVFNWRSWTGLSLEEVTDIEQALGYRIPTGCLLENIRVSGIPNFSKLEPGTRLVFPAKSSAGQPEQAILAIWEENGPCRTVGERLENLHNSPGLKTDFIRQAQNKRGVIGFVLAAGVVNIGDSVRAYRPVR